MAQTALTFLIDDDEIFVFAMKRLIELKNFCKEVRHYPSVAKAIAYFTTHKNDAYLLPDVVFIDINLQSETGWEFIDLYAELSSELAKNTRIYMLSSSISEADLARATQHPSIAGYLSKPLSKDDLALIFES